MLPLSFAALFRRSASISLRVGQRSRLLATESTEEPAYKDLKAQIEEKYPKRPAVVKIFQNLLHLSEENASNLFDEDRANIELLTTTEISKQIELLFARGVDREVMLQYSWVMTMNPKALEVRLGILTEMDSQNVGDYIPLIQLSVNNLMRIRERFEIERDILKGSNRVQYLAKKLGVPAVKVSESICKHRYLVHMDFTRLDGNLDQLLHYNVDPKRILRNPFAVQYQPHVVKARLEAAKNAKFPRIHPHLVQTGQRIFDDTVKLQTAINEALGDSKNTVEYLSKRLGYPVEEVEAHMSKCPMSLKVKAPKVKAMVDFILNEAKLAPETILYSPRTLCFGVETIKRRYREVVKAGGKLPSLSPICTSKPLFERYLKYVKSLQKEESKSPSS